MKQFGKILMGLITLGVLACDTDERPALGEQDYIPLQKGWFQIYDVTQIWYEFGQPETLRYELKTVVADSFKNHEGNYTYVVHRSTRAEGSASWTELDTWSIRHNSQESVVQEENIPFVVLSFPLIEGKEWNANLYNNEINPNTNTNEDLYELVSKGADYTAGGVTFSDCVIVNQEDNQDFIVYQDKRTEVYSRNVGLIFKERIQLTYCSTAGCVGEQEVEDGEVYQQVIKSYGKE